MKIEEIVKALGSARQFMPPMSRSVILTHPDNLKLLVEKALPNRPADITPPWSIGGIEIRASKYIPLTVKVSDYEFPKERFWKYEPQDKAWCKVLGIGRQREIDTGEPLFYMMQDDGLAGLCFREVKADV